MTWDNNPGGQQEGLPNIPEMSKNNCNMRKGSL
jgi:hypothetical protein